MRPRGKDKHLPACVYRRHGAYWYVKRGVWKRLGDNLPAALQEYGRIIAPPIGGCDVLLERTLDRCRDKAKAGKLADNTIKQYAVVCKQLKLNLSEFSPGMVRAHHVAAILDHDRSTPNMANRKLTFLRLAFTNALTWGMAESNPTYGVGRLEEAKRGRLVTAQEFRSVQAKAAPHLQLVMELAYLTGQRIMDVVKIKLSDVTDEGISFQQQKTKKRLLVRMAPEIRAVLDRAKALHTNIRGLTLFHQRGGKPYSYGAIRDAFRRACALADVLDYLPNDHRAMSLSAADTQGKDAQKLGGHTSRAMTERYIRHRQTEVVDGPTFAEKDDEAKTTSAVLLDSPIFLNRK